MREGAGPEFDDIRAPLLRPLPVARGTVAEARYALLQALRLYGEALTRHLADRLHGLVRSFAVFVPELREIGRVEIGRFKADLRDRVGELLGGGGLVDGPA